MLAVDPSSRRSGGALLGDRARIEFDAADRGVLIRSTAAGERLGGLAWPTRAAAHALAAAFDVVVIETVGVGQAETEIVDVADTVAVVVQPGSGDALQFLKSGIMEIPDVLVVTKADLGQLAVRTRRDLSASLRSLGSRSTPVLAVSSLPPPQGIDELIAALAEHRAGIDLAGRRLRRAAQARWRTTRRARRARIARPGRPSRRRGAAGRAGAGPGRTSARGGPGAKRARPQMARDLLMILGSVRPREPARRRARRDQPRHRARLRADRARGDDGLRAAQALTPDSRRLGNAGHPCGVIER